MTPEEAGALQWLFSHQGLQVVELILLVLILARLWQRRP
jgi:hypothetical protein